MKHRITALVNALVLMGMVVAHGGQDDARNAKVSQVVKRECEARKWDAVEIGKPLWDADGTWHVNVWRIPKKPGGFALVTGKGEKISDWGRGL